MTNKNRVLIIGTGFYGIRTLQLLAKSDVFSKIVVGELDLAKAEAAAAQVTRTGKEIIVKKVDATSEPSLLDAMKGVDMVVNITGPFHLTAIPTIKAAMKAGINYLDINANISTIRDVLALDREVAAAGISALICFGDIPGMGSLVARHGINKLDDVTEIHIASGGGRYRFPLVGIDRLWRNIFSMPVIYRDGEFIQVEAFSDPEIIQPPGSAPFKVVLANLPTTVTMPHAIPGVKLVTFKSGMGPDDIGTDLMATLFKWGMDSAEPIDVKGVKVAPVDFGIAFLASDAHSGAIGLLNRDLNDVSGTVYNGFQFKIIGRKNGQEARCLIGYNDTRYCMTESTCWLAAELLVQGEIRQKGVVVPEALDPQPFLAMAKQNGVIIRETIEQML